MVSVVLVIVFKEAFMRVMIWNILFLLHEFLYSQSYVVVKNNQLEAEIITRWKEHEQALVSINQESKQNTSKKIKRSKSKARVQKEIDRLRVVD